MEVLSKERKKEFDKMYKEIKAKIKFEKKLNTILKKYPLPKN